MAGQLRGKLTPLGVKRATKRGLHSDGGGLNLQIAKGGSKSYIFRYRAKRWRDTSAAVKSPKGAGRNPQRPAHVPSPTCSAICLECPVAL